MKRCFTLFVIILTAFLAKAQELQLPLNNDYKMEIEAAAYSSEHVFHTALRPWIEHQFDGILDKIKSFVGYPLNQVTKPMVNTLHLWGINEI